MGVETLEVVLAQLVVQASTRINEMHELAIIHGYNQVTEPV